MNKPNASIPIPFALDEPVWWIGSVCREERTICPECAGTKVLELIKGNGERIAIDCSYCQSGYDPPTGVVLTRIFERVPTIFIPRTVTMWGDEFAYNDGLHHAYAKDLFLNENECAARCAELNKAREKDDEQRAVANLASKRRQISHSSHYWSRKVKEIERDLERAKARLARCKKPAPQLPLTAASRDEP